MRCASPAEPKGGDVATVTILGAGVMGSAIALPAHDNGHTVRLVGTHLDSAIIASLQQAGLHTTLKLALPRAISAYPAERLREALAEVDLVVCGVSTAGIGWAAQALAAALPHTVPILSVTKGLHCDPTDPRRQIQTLTSVLQREILAAGGPDCAVLGVGGPCIALELAQRRRTCVIFGGETPAVDQAARLFGTSYYQVETTGDLWALELVKALKNVLTVPVGIAAAEGQNAAAAVFAQGIAEMRHLLEACATDGHDARPAATNSVGALAAALPGAGDYYVTCSGGRNMRFGRHLGAGLSCAEALTAMGGATIEAIATISALGAALPALYARGVARREELPLLEYLIEMMAHGRAAPLPFAQFGATPEATRA